MIQFKHSSQMKRYNVLAPYVLADVEEMVTVASISEDKEPKVTLHRDVPLRLLKQIIMKWDEKVHMDTVRTKREEEELNQLLEDKPKNKEKGE